MHPIILGFHQEFERFFFLLEKQILLFPEELWTKKLGGYLIWHHFFHTLAIAELYATPDTQPRKPRYGFDVIMFATVPETPMSKKEILSYAHEVKATADNFLCSLTLERLSEKHDAISQALGKDMTIQTGAIGLIRHTCYHLGCCDTILRDHGILGVY